MRHVLGGLFDVVVVAVLHGRVVAAREVLGGGGSHGRCGGGVCEVEGVKVMVVSGSGEMCASEEYSEQQLGYHKLRETPVKCAQVQYTTSAKVRKGLYGYR